MNLQELSEKIKDYKYIKNDKDALAAVNQNGNSLQYVLNQTDDICLAAVKKNGNCLQYVLKQTEDICLAAVNENGSSLQYVINQTEEICLAAVNQKGYSLQYVKIEIIPKVVELTLEDVCKLLGREIKIIK